MTPAIAVMSRLPIPDKTKTRLIDPMTAEEGAVFHLACLKDVSEVVRELNLPSYLYVTGDNYECFKGKHLTASGFAGYGLTDEEWSRFIIRVQVGENLGERMSHIFRDLLTGHSAVLIIGTDIPGILPRDLRQGLQRLQSFDLVMGPAVDGGYYLIGMNNYYPELFIDIPWGTGEVLSRTLAAAVKNGRSYSLLESKIDIDTFQDVCAYHSSILFNHNQVFSRHANRFLVQMIHKYHCHNKKGETPCSLKIPLKRL